MPKIIPPFTASSDRGYKFLRVFDQYYASRGGRLVLWVEGGIAPYDWVVTGSDFTLDDAQTAVQYNFITIADDATLDNRETITITDANNVSVTIVVCTCNPNICSEFLYADQDYTGFTEVDSGSDITIVDASNITVSTMQRVANSHVSKSYGSNYFGDCKIRFKINWTAADDGGNCNIFSISDTYFTEQDQQDNSDGIRATITQTGAVYKIVLRDQELANQDDFDFGSLPGERWCQFERAGAVATLKIYTDAFSTLEDTLSIVCNTTQYEYYTATASRDRTAGGTETLTYSVEDTQLVTNNPDYVTLEFGTLTPNILSLGCHSTLITAAGGCPPYQWTITDGETELSTEWTNRPSNKIKCPEPDCSSGGCTFEITISDREGNSISGPCPSTPAFAFNDDSTSDTVDPGNSIPLILIGGVGPYTWSVVGTGFTLDDAETNSGANMLNCSAGTCGVHYAAFAKVTVTDACGAEIDFTIRASTGSWSSILVMSARCFGSCSSCTGGQECGTAPVIIDYEDEFKWITSGHECSHDSVEWCTTGVEQPLADRPPSCRPDPCSFGDSSVCSADHHCHYDSSVKYVWGC